MAYRKVKTNRVTRLMLLWMTAVLMSGCATWTYDGQTYNSSAEALQAARLDIQNKVNVITPREQPLSNSAMIFTPSLSWSRRGVAVQGAATEEQIGYVATVLYYGYYGMADAVKRRNIFGNAQIAEFSQRDPLGNPRYDYLVWLRLDSPDSAQWVIAPGNDTSLATPLYASPISEVGDRIVGLLDSIEAFIQEPK